MDLILCLHMLGQSVCNYYPRARNRRELTIWTPSRPDVPSPSCCWIRWFAWLWALFMTPVRQETACPIGGKEVVRRVPVSWIWRGAALWFTIAVRASACNLPIFVPSVPHGLGSVDYQDNMTACLLCGRGCDPRGSRGSLRDAPTRCGSYACDAQPLCGSYGLLNPRALLCPPWPWMICGHPNF